MKVVTTFSTSQTLEDRLEGRTKTLTLTIDFSMLSQQQILELAAETVKIRQIQPLIRAGKEVSDVVYARPIRAKVDLFEQLRQLPLEKRMEIFKMLQPLFKES